MEAPISTHVCHVVITEPARLDCDRDRFGQGRLSGCIEPGGVPRTHRLVLDRSSDLARVPDQRRIESGP
jgi:hypothetical protein